MNAQNLSCDGPAVAASSDGTKIAFEKRGTGPALILIGGALNDRGSQRPYLGHADEARRWLAAFNRISGGASLASIRRGESIRIPDRFDIFLEGLRLGGMAED